MWFFNNIECLPNFGHFTWPISGILAKKKTLENKDFGRVVPSELVSYTYLLVAVIVMLDSTIGISLTRVQI